MAPVPLPSVDDALSRAKDAISQNQKCIGFYGMPGSGRTTVIDRLASEYPKRVRVRMPRDEDGAVAAIAALAAQLPAPALDIAKDTKQSYSKRLDGMLKLFPKDAALFFDDPQLLPSASPGDETIFSLRAREFSAELLKLELPLKVFSTAASSEAFALLNAHLVEVKREADPKAVLDLAGLPSAAITPYSGLMAERSPIEIRLASWLWERVDLDALKKTGFRLRELVRLAARHLSAGVRLMLARLSLVREASVSSWLHWAAEGVKPSEQRLVEQVFLFGDDGQRLHGTIAALATAEAWLPDAKRASTHRSLAEAYKARFAVATKARRLGDALKYEIESVHHRTMAGDATLLEDSLYFAEQYDVLGRAFGQKGERLLLRGAKAQGKASIRHAIKAYQRALEHDASDWYAAHYLAFNHDVLGEDVVRIEELYQEAIKLRMSFVWGHSRWVRFLITCGRHDDAAEAFATALERCAASGGPRFYDELHLDVARQYLQFGAYSDALAVLERVPLSVRGQLPRYEPLLRYAQWQREPDHDELVYPPALPLEQRASPVFLQEGEVSAGFMPGRLASVAGKAWRFRVKLPSGQFGWREETREHLVRMGLGGWLRIGAFVEFLKVKKQDGKLEERASVHPSVDPFKDLEVRYPAPDRFAGA